MPAGDKTGFAATRASPLSPGIPLSPSASQGSANYSGRLRGEAKDRGSLLAGLAEETVEIGDSALQPHLERDPRLPIQHITGAGDVGAALHGVVHRQRLPLDPRARAGHDDDLFRQLAHGGLDGVAEI